MSAVETLKAACAAGIRVSVDSSELVLDADDEPSEALVEALRRDKAEVLALLRGSVAERGSSYEPVMGLDLHGLTIGELQEAAGEDWPIVRDDPAVLESLTHAVANRRHRERGERPPQWIASCVCSGCGPVFLWPESPGRVSGCPWCFNRGRDLPIPRPTPVTCGTCRYFRRVDHPNLGHCAKGEPEAIAGLWDTDRRWCSRWYSLEQNQGDRAYGR